MKFCPSSEIETAEVVRMRREARKPIRIIGANTRSGVNADGADILETTRLSGIVDYDPSEMVMTARTGTPVAEIEALLAGSNQHLAFEPVDLRAALGTRGEPTIGGVIATNSSGPARFVNGAARDHLLGLRFVNGAGEIVKAGGRVMKNVTGLDLPKLLAGSRGELGVITEVTFKVLPRPQTSASVVLSCTDDAKAATAMAAALRLPVSVTGAAFVPADVENRGAIEALPAGGAVLLRLEGLGAAVRERREKLRSAMAAFGAVHVLDDRRSSTIWHGIRHVAPFAKERDRALWRVSLPPMSAHQFVAAIKRHAMASAFYDWQGGLVWLETTSSVDGNTIRVEAARAGGGHARLVRPAGGPMHEQRSVSAPVQALSARIKAALDPQSIFSPTFMPGY